MYSIALINSIFSIATGPRIVPIRTSLPSDLSHGVQPMQRPSSMFPLLLDLDGCKRLNFTWRAALQSSAIAVALV